MAKQLVSPIERHVDKAVLGLTVLALVGVLALYGITTPNQVDLRGTGDMVKPGEIEDRLAEKAKEVRGQIQRAPAVEPDVVLKFDEFSKATDAFAAAGISRELLAAVAFNPEPPLVGPPVVVEGYIELAKTVPLSKPTLRHGRSILQLPVPSDAVPEQYQRITEWVSLAALFDRERQSLEQVKEYNSFPQVVFGPIEVERRAMRPDGSYSEWKPIKLLTNEIPEETPPTIGLVTVDGVVSAADGDFTNFELYRTRLGGGAVQLELMRPLFPEVVAGDEWKLPLPPGVGKNDLLKQDEDIMDPNGEPTDSPDDRYPAGSVDLAPVPTGDGPATPEEVNKQRFAQAKSLREEAEKNNSEELIIQSNNLLADIANDPKSPAADKTKAKQLYDEGVQVKFDILARIRAGLMAGTGKQKPRPGEDQVYVRPLQPSQLVWAFDAQPESLQPGQTYQYRMRVGVLNPFAGRPKMLKNKADAAKVFVTGEWSDPSDPITIPPDRQFFVTSVAQSGQKSEAVVEMFRWFDGVWVKNKTAFKFGVGARLAGQERHDVPLKDPAPGGPYVHKALIDYAADAVVLNIEPERTFRGVQKAGKNLRFQPNVKQAVVAFVDAEGNVFERFAPLDKSSPERTMLAGLEYEYKPESKKVEPDPGTAPPPPPPGRGKDGGGGGG